MTDRPHRGAIDYEQLARYFRGLSIPTRVQLLHKLQVPQSPSEIRLPPFRRDPSRRADRAISRQAVEGHLKKLQELGLVRSRASTREGQPVREYVVNQPRLFVAVDEMRRLALIRTAAGASSQRSVSRVGTLARDAASVPIRLPGGPALVLVSGPLEGQAFALDGAGPWVVGRARETDVPLDYDPYVSARNSEVSRAHEGFFVRSLAGARNGTTVNWRLLAAGERAVLGPADTLGVGRSLLVFRSGPPPGDRPGRK